MHENKREKGTVKIEERIEREELWPRIKHKVHLFLFLMFASCCVSISNNTNWHTLYCDL
jgi:hypothetical protein